VSDSCFIANIFGATSSGGVGVFINSVGQLGTSTSSRRFKDEIKPMAEASDALFGLRPVTFRYKKEIDPKRIAQFGLVAEDVEAVNSDLVVRDKDGKPYSVRYEQVNAMLLNEFLKEHKKVQKQQTTNGQLESNAAKQEATISELKSDLQTVVARLKDQDLKIQRVSAEVEMNKRSSHVVATNP
jgi:trimeric autotransporter adhesin